jgi:type IV secretory pathway VirB2 component (pilin)
MKPRFGALALVRQYRLLRGEIDWELIALMVVTISVLLGATVWFLE